MKERDRPFYQIVDGHRLPGIFREDVYRSGLLYKPVEGDVVLDTFPKSGSHWVLKILKESYRLCKGITPGSTFLEMFGLEGVLRADRPRIVCTHLPLTLLPFVPSVKYIYLARNPKDCCVSFYNHTKIIPEYGFQDGTFDEYFEIFLDGLTDFGNYYDSIRSWYAKRDEPNVLFLTYESLHADIRGSVIKLAGFVDQALADELSQDDNKMQTVLEEININNMKKNLPLQFVRKGVVGEWKHYFSEEQSRKLESRFFLEMEETTVPEIWESVDWLLASAKRNYTC
ncbi:sulfotransferase ssu-1 [Ixodes scapularis]